MQPWQVEFELIPRPRPAADAARAASATQAPRAWSADRPLPGDFLRRVETLGLALTREGSEAGVRAWGRPDGNRLEVRETSAGATRVHVAVDARKLDPAFAAALLGLVKAVNGVLVRADGLTIDGTVGAFSKALRSAPAWAYVDDPTGLLTGREPAGDDEG